MLTFWLKLSFWSTIFVIKIILNYISNIFLRIKELGDNKKYSSFSDKVPKFDNCNIHPNPLPETHPNPLPETSTHRGTN